MNADTNPVIRIRGLVTRMGDRILHDHINLDVQRGEILAVVGSSGSGKSVLLRSIIGLQPVREGHIEVLGQNVSRLDGDDLVQLQVRWGVLFQDGALFSDLTVGQNIKVPLREHADLPQDLINEIASVNLKSGPPFSAMKVWPPSSKVTSITLPFGPDPASPWRVMLTILASLKILT